LSQSTDYPFILFDSDGRLIFFDADGFLSEALPSGEIHQLGSPALAGYPFPPSADGKWVPLVGQNACLLCGLRLLSTVTGTSRPVTLGGRVFDLASFAFSPDSKSVLLQSRGRELLV